jgi:hypothetical protein
MQSLKGRIWSASSSGYEKFGPPVVTYILSIFSTEQQAKQGTDHAGFWFGLFFDPRDKG